MTRGIACRYCGGRHALASEARACWERSRHPARPASTPASTPAPAPAPASARARTPAAPLSPAAATTGTLASGPVLGRSVLVRAAQSPPAAWSGCDRWDGTPEHAESAWRRRLPLVIEADDPPADDEVLHRPVWSLTPSFAFPGECLRHYLHSNAADARGGEPRWRWSEAAVRLGASPGGPADVVLPGGQPAFCDGGPLEWFAPQPDGVVLHRTSVLSGSLVPFGPNATDADLAPDQRAAVTHPTGAARIIAPAGSGKTRVLTERARHLLRQWKLPGDTVTLLAFNKRAADEMVSRTTDLPELQVRTLNAMALALLNRAHRVSTIDELEVRSILDSLVDLPRRANTDPAVAWIEALSSVRLGLADPAEVEAEYGGDVDGLTAVFPRYREILAGRSVVDFDEQIYRAIELLITDAGARRSARATCRVLLVDEFQDLTPAHLLLIRLLAGPDGQVYGVGDDDQTIYGYAGASPEWLVDYRRFFPQAGEHPLEVNYRCPLSVVTAAATLLTHNRHRVAKTITPAPGRARDETALRVLRHELPVDSTVDAVVSTVRAGADPRDVAVLTRVNAALVPVQIGLREKGVPFRAAVDESYLSRGGVRAALGWLRLVTGRSGHWHGADIAAAARRPSRALSPSVLEWMAEQRDSSGLERLAGRLKDRDARKIEGFVADLRRLTRTARSGTAADVLRVLRDDVGLDQAMEMLEGSRRRLDRSAQTDDLDSLVALARLHPRLEGFEAWLHGSLQDHGTPEGVTLATIHSMKGREWPHVCIHDVSAGVIPHRLAVDVEEERRIFHVALTRCSSSVTVVAGGSPSPFIEELFTEQPAGIEPPTTAVPAAAVRPRVGPRPAPPRRPVDPRAVKALRQWRAERARADKKPAYVFLTDATIDEIASALPVSLVALGRIKGIGPAKLGAYGDEILTLLERARDAT